LEWNTDPAAGNVSQSLVASADADAVGTAVDGIPSGVFVASGAAVAELLEHASATKAVTKANVPNLPNLLSGFDIIFHLL